MGPTEEEELASALIKKNDQRMRLKRIEIESEEYSHVKQRKAKVRNPLNPKKGDTRVMENGRTRMWTGKAWKTVCDDCKKVHPTFGVNRTTLWCKACAVKNHRNEYINLYPNCEDCKTKHRSSFGTVDLVTGKRKKRWCAGCAKNNHKDEYVDFQAKCEDCKLKTRHYGIVDPITMARKPKWCKGCSVKNHNDEYVDFHEKCEDCKLIGPSYGIIDLITETNKRKWCFNCAEKNHKNDYIDFGMKCEDCKLRHPSHGIVDQTTGDNKRKWCATCAKRNHEEECIDFRTKCEDCKLRIPSYGIVDPVTKSRKRKWCIDCAKTNHEDDYVNFQAKCEDCDSTGPSYGIIDSVTGGKKRKWCARCANEKHKEECVDFNMKCEDCNLIAPSFGIIEPITQINRRKWCSKCAKKNHNGKYVDFNPKCTTSGCNISVVKNGLCTVHHPDYQEPVSGCSKESCECLDALAEEVQQTIMHYCYSVDGENKRSNEYKPVPGRQYRNDGFIEKLTLTNQQTFPFVSNDPDIRASKIAFEYQGSRFHGHPSMWKDSDESPDEHPLYQNWLKDVDKWRQCAKAYVEVFYILDTDFKQWKKLGVGHSLLQFIRHARQHF